MRFSQAFELPLFILAGSGFSDTHRENRRLMQSKPPLQEVPSVLAATPVGKAPPLREGLFIASGCLLILSWFPSRLMAQGLASRPSPAAADASRLPSVTVSEVSPKPISGVTPAEPPSQKVVQDINALINKSPSEAKSSPEVKNTSEATSAPEVKSASEGKSASEVKSASEAKSSPEVKSASEVKNASEAKSSPEVKSTSEVKSASEVKNASEAKS